MRIVEFLATLHNVRYVHSLSTKEEDMTSFSASAVLWFFRRNEI